MWSDNETNRDFVNFRAVADTAAEMIVQAGGRPLSMGVSGSWGVGKSSLIRLIRASLEERTDQKFVFVEFNAWLYQGYDDARAALLDVIARALLENAKGNEDLTAKAKGLLERVNWARTAGLAGMAGVSVALGYPLPGLLGAAWKAFKGMTDGDITEEDVEAAKKAGKDASDAGKKLIKDKPDTSPPQQIQDLRNHFEKTLEEMGVTLIVLIDDLDRCLPATAIATLEAIRHFLFLDHTAFVIAADDKMIRQAVKVHFKDIALDDDLVTNYFDKLIQIPIRVPPLGTQDVRAYLMLLFIENSGLPVEQRDEIRTAVCQRLSETWQGKRIDIGFVKGLIKDCTPELAAQLALADRLAPLMTTSDKIAGNPRLIKRFLNTLHIRLATAKAQKVAADEATLAKLLLFERCGKEEAYRQLVREVNDSEEGKPLFLAPWETAALKGAAFKPDPPWEEPFARVWLALEPSFADTDLRAAVYVSRDHMPIVMAADQLSKEAVDLLEAVLKVTTQVSTPVADKLKGLSPREQALVSDRVLHRARQTQDWGTPPIFYACLTLASVSAELASRFAGFLRTVPPNRISPALIPILSDKPWAKELLAYWTTHADTSGPVKNAITPSVKVKK
ncbi:MAG: P-loop NTPase fold protein [Hyphomicrobiaceae bacterium]